MNNIETIDGVRGEWRTVTKAEECHYDQQIRWIYDSVKHGYDKDKYRFSEVCKNLFGECERIQAFFHLPDKRKVANVTIGYDFDCRGKEIFHFIIKKERWHFMVTPKFGGAHYSSRKSALRGAQRFCKAIGWEMEVVK